MAVHFEDRPLKDFRSSDKKRMPFQRSNSTPAPAKKDNAAKRGLRPDQQNDALLITQDSDLRTKLLASFEDKNHFALRTIGGRISDIEENVSTLKMPDLVIFDLNNGNLVDIEALDRLKKTKFSKTPSIVLSTYLDQDIVRSLMQMKMDDWLPKDSPPLDVHRACEKAMRTRAAASRDKEASCYSFFSTTGGCGNTTLAIQTAFHVGRKAKNMRSTCLVDLNFQDGTICDYLDLTPAFQIEELSSAPGRLDEQLLEVMLSRHSSGLAVLATPRSPARYLEISEGLVVSVLGLLSKSFDNLIIDLPKNWYPWTDNVIWGSHKVFVTSAFSVPSLRQARFLADAIISKAASDTDVSVIVNKLEDSFLGSGLMRKDAERVLSSRLGGFIPDMGSIVDEAINRGLAISDVKPGSKLEKRLGEILDREKAPAKA